MPVLKPFSALMPARHLQDKVVTRPLETYGSGEARLIASENEHSFLHLINPSLDHQYLRGSRQELIFKKIAENLDHFQEKGFLKKASTPCLYVYRVTHGGMVQTGIWTLTHIAGYIDGSIKKHEHTVEKREQLLADYLQQTGLDANPVLITYTPNKVVTATIARQTHRVPDLDFVFADASHHQVWAISDVEEIKLIQDAFAAMESVYIADGHHRIASMTKMGKLKASLNSKHNGKELYNYFTSVYMDTNQVKVLEFNRLVKDTGTFTTDEFLAALSDLFILTPSEIAVHPEHLHELGMYLIGQWYKLIPRPEILNDADPVMALDVSLLHEKVLHPLLGIIDPRTDTRIDFVGGNVPVGELQKRVDGGQFAMAFTLFPTSLKQLMDVADANSVMPPKSTWVEPKFLVGLLTNRF